jgi:hypothetical protein
MIISSSLFAKAELVAHYPLTRNTNDEVGDYTTLEKGAIKLEFMGDAPNGAKEKKSLLLKSTDDNAGALFIPSMMIYKEAGGISFWTKSLNEYDESKKTIYLLLVPPFVEGITITTSGLKPDVIKYPIGGVFTVVEHGLEQKKWQHVVLTWNSSGESFFYIDGKLAKRDKFNQSNFNPNIDFEIRIGNIKHTIPRNPINDDYENYQYSGLLHGLKFFRGEVDLNQVEELYKKP